MKEALIYLISAIASLIVLGYSVHILIGGMVSEQTETIAITIAMIAGAGVIGWMVRDVLRRRSQQGE
ncbi:MAG: hypothetical protein Q9M26_09500 [Mariprofundales bacterium]|nr:hypothetical protein [Mariprofundales bacterium]